jgi:hypothetical protein
MEGEGAQGEVVDLVDEEEEKKDWYILSHSFRVDLWG